ncbi:MAG: T9SS type A sorting domain-containing protein [Paludibacter sp.]
MKNILTTVLIIFFCCQINIAQNTFTGSFETFDSTPYYFRFGNSTSITYYPRWKYSHQVVDNPLINSANSSAKVLRYSSLEARWYGLKFKFSAPLNIEDIDTLSFDIYQSANIVGKAVNTTYSSTQATTQEIHVKLLTYFNTTQDSREDAGVALTFSGAVVPFTQIGDWYNYKVLIDKSKFTSANLTTLSTGVLGIAIMPTYNSGVTLQTEYVCYIDNIKTRPLNSTGTSTVMDNEKLKVFSNGSVITLRSGMDTNATVNLYDVKGTLLKTLLSGKLEQKEYLFQSNLSGGVYFVSVNTEGRFRNFKIVI